MEDEPDGSEVHPTSVDHAATAVVDLDDPRRALVDLAPVGLSYSDETGNLVYVNDRWRHLARCDDPCPIPLARVIELIHPGDHVAVLGAMTTATRRRTEATALLRLADPDDDRQLSLIVRHMPLGVHESVRFISILSDVTELTRALDEVRRSEQRFRTVTSTLPVAVFRTGPGGEVTWANEWMKEISGYDLDEFLGRSSFDLVHPDALGRGTQPSQPRRTARRSSPSTASSARTAPSAGCSSAPPRSATPPAGPSNTSARWRTSPATTRAPASSLTPRRTTR